MKKARIFRSSFHVKFFDMFVFFFLFRMIRHWVNSLFRVHAEMLWVREIQNCIHYTLFLLFLYKSHMLGTRKRFFPLFLCLSSRRVTVLVYGAIGFYCFYFNNLKWHIFAERLINYSWFFFFLCLSYLKLFVLSLFFCLFVMKKKWNKKSIIWISGRVKSSHMNRKKNVLLFLACKRL